MHTRITAIVAIFGLAACAGDPAGTEPSDAFTGDATKIIELLDDEHLIFGIFVPSDDGVFTAERAAELGQNEFLDFLFLDLEGNPYDISAVEAYVEGLSRVAASDRPTLLVRIPTIGEAGYELTRQRTEEVLRAGADGIVYPHILSLEMASRTKDFWENIGASVWSPGNPDGRIVTMLMIEDREAVEAAAEIADLGGYSMLSCGIGSLSSALGSPEQGEAGCLEVLRNGARAGMPSIQLAFDTDVLQRRISQGYDGILMRPSDDIAALVSTGRAATGR